MQAAAASSLPGMHGHHGEDTAGCPRRWIKVKTMKDSAARTEYRPIATSAGSGADRSNLE